jgi:alpha-L-rhamnosidase
MTPCADLDARYRLQPITYFRGSSRPYVRWWWLAGPFTKEDIRSQLQWVRDSGFGGVELAWIYPSWLDDPGDDRLRPRWLDEEWSELVAFTKAQCDQLGLGCDFTAGSAWPFGGSQITKADASQTFFGPSEQRLRGTWEGPYYGPTLIVNHLSAGALNRYAEPVVHALKKALGGSPSALVCDSLELATEDLWSPGLWEKFEEQFGYDLKPLAEDMDETPDVRYDYRKLIGETIRREFYEQFVRICHQSGAYARVQCHGAPSDLLQCYAAVDVPESEAILFRPPFSRIAASAAAWAAQPVVSAEMFTCIYGFPGWQDEAEEFWKREKLGDLKMLADACFAEGVNQIVWHGMPYQPTGEEIEFYASVHVGPDSPFASELPSFNLYLQQLSAALKLGTTYGQLGIYLPFEDALMLDEIADDERTPGANYYWEMRHAVVPDEVRGFAPLWISQGFLREARVNAEERIVSRRLEVEALYVDCEWLDTEALHEFTRLASSGARIIWKRETRQPGRNQSSAYTTDLAALLRQSKELEDLQPLISGRDIPPYFARNLKGTAGNDLLIFFAHPRAHGIRYPLPYNHSAGAGEESREITLHWNRHVIDIQLRFEPQQSLLFLVAPAGTVEQIDIGYRPRDA